MPKFKLKVSPIDAIQWWENGEHPEDACETFTDSDGRPFQSEGKIVRYFRHPKIKGTDRCATCGYPMKEHGWLDPSNDRTSTFEEDTEGQKVCPGDWILTNPAGKIWYCSRQDFSDLYEPFDKHDLQIQEILDQLAEIKDILGMGEA